MESVPLRNRKMAAACAVAEATENRRSVLCLSSIFIIRPRCDIAHAPGALTSGRLSANRANADQRIRVTFYNFRDAPLTSASPSQNYATSLGIAHKCRSYAVLIQQQNRFHPQNATFSIEHCIDFMHFRTSVNRVPWLVTA